MYKQTETCPECNSENIQEIDRGFDVEEQKKFVRMMCMDCNNDWREYEEE